MGHPPFHLHKHGLTKARAPHLTIISLTFSVLAQGGGEVMLRCSSSHCTTMHQRTLQVQVSCSPVRAHE